MRSHWSFTKVATAVCLLAAATSWARADRLLLAPRGSILLPQSVRFTALAYEGDVTDGLGWLALGPLVADLDLEWEVEGYDLGRDRLGSVNAQYLLTTEAFSDVAPVISVGLRDILSTGPYGRTAYLAGTQRVALSAAQERVVREVRVHAGYGSGTMGGAYAGIEARTAWGFSVMAEGFSRRLNYGVSVPVCAWISLRACSLNGDGFVGASVTVMR